MSGSLLDWPRVCLHADMDAFFVSVELLRRPELRGRPVIVATGTDPSARGVVMAASYEARRFGVGSAMPLVRARSACPDAVLIDRDMGLYRRASGRVMEVMRRFGDRLEVAGLDEAYLDLTGSPAPKARARQLKSEIRAETGLVCSVGLAPNKLLAKIASDLDKPDGFRVLEADQLLDAVGERPARLIPGVGPRTAERLGRAGIRTVRELAGASSETLASAIGARQGLELRDRALGRDKRPVVVDREQKSESRETTFSTDVTDPAILRETLGRLVDSLCRGLAEGNRTGRTVTLKIRLRPFRTHTRSRTLDRATRDPAQIGAVAEQLLEEFGSGAPIRLLGVGVSNLDRSPGPTGRESVPANAQGTLAL